MTAEQLASLLGRPLTTQESANFELYLDIAKQNLESILCTPVCKKSEVRVFDARKEYSTVFTDIFTDVHEVKVDGVAVTNYTARQWDKRNANWYNSLVFDTTFDTASEITVDASWGFTLPSDLKLVLAGLFNLITKRNKFDPAVTQKRVEDFSISLDNSVVLDDEFTKQFGGIIAKYSMCEVPYVSHGGC
ncbi:hypothetical protein EOL73_03815 [Candidatus Saccharibacteria bacterium]|nr:hypothetical protein [Candidatus Saccharibacteria bacterium]